MVIASKTIFAVFASQKIGKFKNTPLIISGFFFQVYCMHTNHSIPEFPIIPVKPTAIQQHYNIPEKNSSYNVCISVKKGWRKKSKKHP